MVLCSVFLDFWEGGGTGVCDLSDWILAWVRAMGSYYGCALGGWGSCRWMWCAAGVACSLGGADGVGVCSG